MLSAPCLKKTVLSYFYPEICEISTNCENFSHKDGKEDAREKVYCSRISDIDELKTRLINEWAQFDQSIIDAAISQQRYCLRAFVRLGGHTNSGIKSDNF